MIARQRLRQIPRQTQDKVKARQDKTGIDFDEKGTAMPRQDRARQDKTRQDKTITR